MRKQLLFAALTCILLPTVSAQFLHYPENSDKEGFKIIESSSQNVALSFSVKSWSMSELTVNRETLKHIELPGNFLPNDEGYPDLPGSGRYLAIPQGSVPHLNILSLQTEVIENIDLAPAPRIPKTTDNGPLQYVKNASVFSKNEFYPSNPVKLSEPGIIRGVDVVMLGITPFQYNPVTKELIVIKNIEVEVIFEGGNGQFGDNRLRSRWWEPLLADMLMNYDQILPVDYSSRQSAVCGQQTANGQRQTANGQRPTANGQRSTGAEYLILCPDDPDFLAWADTVRIFRNKQGISTTVVTTAEAGGNTVSALENYINNAYMTWDIPPAAILILGDYGSSGSTVISPIWDSYCASDNIFADVNNDDMPEMVISRIFAQNADQLELMIGKFISYETNPPVDPEYYDHPVTALGWQTERWFQVCIEVVGGFFRNALGKDPIRINEVYEGNPTVDPWSTAPNTGTIMNYFGPSGLGYIPSTPSELGDWSGGNASDINTAINNGSFLLLHRDHGFEQGWGEPAYSNSNLPGLDNEHLTFVYSVNCLTGKFNYGGECFAEGFYRQPKRALGIIAASEVSYSFVNDTYVWGAFDNMWPEFMPAYGSTPTPRGLLPAFSNAAGKYFLQQSGWPYNEDNKEVTYNLFHHFGDAFTGLFSEVPSALTILHDDVLLGGAASFSVQSDDQSFIALSVDGEIIGVAEGTGSPVAIEIPPQLPGTTVDLVVTKTNHFRYEAQIAVISPNTAYVIYQGHELNDQSGNNDGLMDYGENELLSLTVKNIGMVDAEGITVKLTTADPFIRVTDSVEFAGSIAGNETLTLSDAFEFIVADSVPDGHVVLFRVTSDDGDSTWISQFYVVAKAPLLEFTEFMVDDSGGNDNGRIDPGETVSILTWVRNAGSSLAWNVITGLSAAGEYISIDPPQQSCGHLSAGEMSGLTFSVTAGESTPEGYLADFIVEISADLGRTGNGAFTLVVGRYSALVVDLDPNQRSGPAIKETFDEMDLSSDYVNTMPDDLKNYKSVFVTLGIHFTNHVLTEAEATALTLYLMQGGNVYMEGRLTWFSDPQTGVHPLFGISAEASNWYQLDTIYGIPGTFSEGLKYSYEMNLPYNNHILTATSPAFSVMSALPGANVCMVANDAGQFKTVGANIEIGGLVDGDPPSTRKEAVARILGFFGDILTGTEKGPLEANTPIISAYPNPSSGRFHFRFNLEETSPVKMEIFDATGRMVSRVFEGILQNGDHQLEWESPSGVNGNTGGLYFYRFISGKKSQEGKLLIIN